MSMHCKTLPQRNTFVVSIELDENLFVIYTGDPSMYTVRFAKQVQMDCQVLFCVESD